MFGCLKGSLKCGARFRLRLLFVLRRNLDCAAWFRFVNARCERTFIRFQAALSFRIKDSLKTESATK